MPVGYVMIKGQAKHLESILKYLESLIGNREFTEKSGGIVKDVVATFGWPDFIVTVYSTNLELIKGAIVLIRDMMESLIENVQIETSTIVGVSSYEVEEKRNDIHVNALFSAYEKVGRKSVSKIADEDTSKKIVEWLQKVSI